MSEQIDDKIRNLQDVIKTLNEFETLKEISNKLIAHLKCYEDFLDLLYKNNECYCKVIPYDMDMHEPKCVICQIYDFINEEDEE